MDILHFFKSKIKGKVFNLGIGLGEDYSQNQKIIKIIEEYLVENHCQFHIFGTKQALAELLKESLISEVKFKLIESSKPEREIINYLKKKVINAAIRGNISSRKFLQEIKTQLNIDVINRLALLETFEGNQFFFGPVGIDECNDFEKKINFIEKAIILFKSLKVEPSISILSGGRLSDIGRDNYVDETIYSAQKVVKYFIEKYPKLEIQHNEILIEDAIRNKSNLIIAPEGISGNLIYRTLVHLGGGKAYGAIYIGINYTIIDTSRVGKPSEIKGALDLALSHIT
ncbi:MAG: methanogenesis marker protein Mmp4/MtxX [Candidatus Hodarchaeota archaeon]